MDPKRWSKPITFETTRLGQYRTIVSTQEAARALMNDWPLQKGRQLKTARKTCEAVLEGKKPPSEARNAFIAAAVEADVFVREK
jgi:ribosomal 50S subunit-associated protein YjgA (DUF615 family)